MNFDQFFIFDHATWPVFLVEASGRIRRGNRSAVQTLGASLESGSFLLSSIWARENPIPADQFLAAQGSAEQLILKFRTQGDLVRNYATAISYGTRDGEKFFLFQLLKEASLSDGTKIFTNQSVEASLAHKQKLECALQLARSVALDFNNALTSILGHASLMLAKIETNHPWRSSLVEIEKSASKAAETANDLASFSRQEKDTKVQTPGNVNSILQRTVDLFRTPEYEGITFAFHLERKLFTANVDEAKMQQAFVKVLENAVQSNPQTGRIALTSKNVELSTPTQDRTVKLAPGNYVLVEIEDNGPGISAEILPRIFEPFFSTKGKAHRGLGLAWVYGIITNHGGGVTVSSQVGIGTSVRIYLPANKTIVRADAVNSNDLTGTQTILMVDDEDLLLTMGQMILSSYGYEVLTANSGQKALEIISNTKKEIDLVITDLVMPNMSGRELIEHIRKISPHSKIICSSGIVRNAENASDETYLQKPFTSQDLLRKVKAAFAVY